MQHTIDCPRRLRRARAIVDRWVGIQQRAGRVQKTWWANGTLVHSHP